MADKVEIGKVRHYFSKASVAVVDLSNELNVGDTISIEGLNTNVQQKVISMQIEHQAIQNAKKGQSIGLKVNDRAHEGSTVYKMI